MLLPCLQSHTKCRSVLAIYRNTYDSSGNHTLVLFNGRKISSVRSTGTQRDTKSLSISHYHVRTPITRGAQQTQTHQICCHCNLKASLMPGFHLCFPIDDFSLSVWKLNEDSKKFICSLPILSDSTHNFYT